MSRAQRRLVLWMVVLVGVLTLGLVAAACGSSKATTSKSPSGAVKRGGELTLARVEEPLSLDPVGPSNNGSIFTIEQVFDTLVEPNETGAGLAPGLAEKWDISPDGLQYTFHLRSAKFSNGSPVTAEDVVFSLKRAANPDVSPYAFLFRDVDKMAILDARTVRITLTEPSAPFLSSVAIFAAGIVPKAVVEADPKGFGNKPVGSGPFMVEQYSRGDRVVLVPNPNFWGLGADGKPLPYLDKVTMRYVPESNSRILGLRNGDFDVIEDVPYSQGKSLSATPNIVVNVDEIYKLDYLYVNEQKSPLSSKDFRLALNYATNRKAILDTVFFGYGQLPNSFMPKMGFWDKTVALIPYDPTKAKEYLAKSGYDGRTIQILIASGDAPRQQTAQILQENWAAVGIKSAIQQMDSGAVWDKIVAGDYDVVVTNITSDINDPDELATLQGDYSAPGGTHAFYSWYKNPQVTDLLAKARKTSSPQERANYYGQVQKIIYWDAYSVPFNFTPALTAHWDYVQNWRTLTTGWWWLDQVWMSR